MQYSPKLKKAIEQIKQIVKKNDIAAFVVLHDKSQISEYLNSISPSYSCLFLENGNVRVRLKQTELGKEKAQMLAEGTYNMVTHFSDIIGRHAMMYIELQKLLKDKWGGEEGDSNHTAHEHQNN